GYGPCDDHLRRHHSLRRQRAEAALPSVEPRLGVERRAVGERHALPQRDRDRLGVRAELVTGRQVGEDLAILAKLEELPVDGAHVVLVRGAVRIARRVETERPVTGEALAFTAGDRATVLDWRGL